MGVTVDFAAQLRGTWDEAKGWLVTQLNRQQAQLAPVFTLVQGLQAPTPTNAVLVTDRNGTATFMNALPCPLAFQSGAILSPASIASSTNNYNPTGLTAAAVVRLTSSGGVNLTGLTAASGMKLLVNIGAFTITLTHADTSSSAANRFRCPGASNFSLTTSTAAWVWYDATSLVWQVVG